MSEKTLDNREETNGIDDNMAQEPSVNEEALARELNTDDSISEAGKQLVEEESQLEELQNQLDALKDKHLRLTAEFDNFRRRNAKERMELIQTAGVEMVKALLPVLDDMNRASKQMETTTDVAVLKEGVSLVFNKLNNVLQHKGLKIMDAMNQPFDADLHDAITEIPAPTEELKGKVLDVVEQGYYLNDKLIRHAKVVVGK